MIEWMKETANARAHVAMYAGALLIASLIVGCHRSVLPDIYEGPNAHVPVPILRTFARMHDGMDEEWVLCLDGDIAADDTPEVKSMRAPVVLDSDADSANFWGCRNALGMWHNHPNDNCRPSIIDLDTMWVHRWLFIIVSCGPGRMIIQHRGRSQIDTIDLSRQYGSY